MKLVAVKLKNFRSYQEEIVVPMDWMNIVLGKNDIGKSTILEALDIFFNDWNWCVKISQDDINIYWKDDPVEITCIFGDFDDEIILETVPTSLSWEYLLNEEKLLEIKKVYKWSTMKSNTYLVAYHPNNNDFMKDILLKKIGDLQKFAQKNSIDIEWKMSVSSHIRKAIREHYENLECEIIEIQADKVWEKDKNLRSKLQAVLPTYILFQSDRSNSDQDNEIQNPMNIALKATLKQAHILEKLEEVFNEVNSTLSEIAEWTLEQLHLINPELASNLIPKLPPHDQLAWDKAFKKTEIASDDIPLNKRGSWVKRIVLLSFFLNEVKRRKTEESLADIIYAFEEPETSQHPEHQLILINAFEELSQSEWVQVIVTTHSPYVYKDSINKDFVKLIHIKKTDDNTRDISFPKDQLLLFPHSPTRWEINYFVYELPTFEFFDELYSRIEELAWWDHFDDFVQQQWTILKDQQWKTANNDGSQRIGRDGSPIVRNTTYITCIRHKIHHPNNMLNEWYKTPEEINDSLDRAIKDMISIIEKTLQ